MRIYGKYTEVFESEDFGISNYMITRFIACCGPLGIIEVL